jgi:O-succinylbenzoic acid--CoA ligase
MSGAFGMTSGELLAVDVPPGPAWVGVVHRCWSEGVAFLPLDPRWSASERRGVMDRAQPAAVLDAGGEVTVFGGAAPVAPDVALVIATSGASAAPKLAELSRAAVEAAVRGSVQALADERQTVTMTPWVCCLTPAHVGGLLVLLRGEVTGAGIIAQPRFDPAVVIRVLGERAPASVSLVPSMLAQVVEQASPRDLHDATLLVGGGSVDPVVAQRARDLGARVVTTYGMTETCGGVVYDGVPFSGTEVRIADGPDPAIELRGPTLFSGYRGDPGATGSAFDTKGWFRTHDLGAFDDQGRLAVLGRADDAIRTGGETVWPDEIEGIIRPHPGVRDVAVAGRAHATWGQQVVAFIVPTDHADVPDADELKAWVRDRAASFKAPRRIEIVKSIPRTPSGKIVRRDLPA